MIFLPSLESCEGRTISKVLSREHCQTLILFTDGTILYVRELDGYLEVGDLYNFFRSYFSDNELKDFCPELYEARLKDTEDRTSTITSLEMAELARLKAKYE